MLGLFFFLQLLEIFVDSWKKEEVGFVFEMLCKVGVVDMDNSENEVSW